MLRNAVRYILFILYRAGGRVIDFCPIVSGPAVGIECGIFRVDACWSGNAGRMCIAVGGDDQASLVVHYRLAVTVSGARVQRMYCVNKPVKVKKMALLMSSYSPGVYDGATAEFRDICNYWQVENMGLVSAKIDEQKTEETKQKVIDLVGKL